LRVAISTPSQPVLPTSAQLEAVVLHLEAAHDHRALIRLVERWSAVRAPTTKAQLAQARAFIDLRLMDRAWVRLQELQYDENERIEVLRLTARMFLLRGWPTRAQKPIESALLERPGDPSLKQLAKEVEESLEAAPSTDPGIPIVEEMNLDEALPAAENYLATGAFLKAQRILEILRRKHEENERVNDLLWALEGDFSSPGMTLLGFCERYRPAPQPSPTDSPTPPPPTNTAKIPLFPNLFRDLSDPSIEVTEEVEITELQSFAPISDLPDLPEATDDTDVLHVIGEPIDHDLDSDTFGIDQLPLPPENPIEEEDDHLIVLNRPTDDVLGPRVVTEDLDTIELDPSEDLPLLKKKLAEQARLLDSKAVRTLATGSNRQWLFALIPLLLLLGIGMVGFALLLCFGKPF
jgi:hypothetical protein